MSENYEYERLDLATDALRLCRLIRRPNDPQEAKVIRCELFQALLHQVDGVPYEALSYTWGCDNAADTNRTQPVVVNGFDVPDRDGHASGKEEMHIVVINDKKHRVTTNLFHALSNIRLDDEDRIIWVDALCINQADDRERGHQVAQMAKTYRCAERVLIWLGSGDATVDIAMRRMEVLDREVRTNPRPVGHPLASMLMREKIQLDAGDGQYIYSHIRNTAGQHVYSPIRQQEKKGVSNLYSAAWFRRIWVIQEAANARSALVIYGRCSVQASTFALVPWLFNFEVPTGTQAVLDILPGPRRMLSWWKSKRDLGTLLAKFGSTCEASDERDMIYALLGIASDTASSDILWPDYEVETSVVVKRTAAFLMAARGEICKAELWTPHLPKWTVREFLRVLPEPGASLLQWTLQENLPVAIAVEAVSGVTTDSMNKPKWPGAANSLDKSTCSLVWRLASRTPCLISDLPHSENQYQNLLEVILLRPDINPNIEHCHRTPLEEAALSGHWAVFRLLLKDPRVDGWPRVATGKYSGGRSAIETALKAMANGLDVDSLRSFVIDLPGLMRDFLLQDEGRIPRANHPLLHFGRGLHILQNALDLLVCRLLSDKGKQCWPTLLKSSLISDYIAKHREMVNNLSDLLQYTSLPTFLWLAIALEDVQAVLTWLGLGADVKSPYSTISPLLVSVVTGNVGITRILLENGAQVPIRRAGATPTRHSSPPLSAIGSGKQDMVELLLDYGADIDIEHSWPSPLELARKLCDGAAINRHLKRRVRRF
ncbi:hypothetical protein PspLS_01885 [Pyricularia sp. CBS 133598]|nr:hypothetical protein PspLS_01885 [Pyricularia sp. CBS 133598]